MLLFEEGQRQMLADKLPDAGNLAVGALFFGQFLSDRPFSIILAISGNGAWLVLISVGIVFARKKT